MNMTIELPADTIEQVARRAAEIVKGSLRVPDEPRWTDKWGAAEHLGLSVSKIERLTARDEIPHRHVGGRISYRTSELDKWMLGRASH